MDKHLTELALAHIADAESPPVIEHLRSCRECQRAVGEYRWLQGEITAALKTEAKAIPLPRPRWWDLWERLHGGRGPAAATRRLFAAAGIAMLICSLLVAWSLPTPVNASSALPPKPLSIPLPAIVTADNELGHVTATPTPSQSGRQSPSTLTPALTLYPKP
ncbi:MAG: hypothetical protein JW900_03800 [Anaerolineae bacterium]|nr:hypothetical protein [Anaerolineae bacterium]